MRRPSPASDRRVEHRQRRAPRSGRSNRRRRRRRARREKSIPNRRAVMGSQKTSWCSSAAASDGAGGESVDVWAFPELVEEETDQGGGGGARLEWNSRRRRRNTGSETRRGHRPGRRCPVGVEVWNSRRRRRKTGSETRSRGEEQPQRLAGEERRSYGARRRNTSPVKSEISSGGERRWRFAGVLIAAFGCCVAIADPDGDERVI
uniref:Uncharacterized protein n=1 Tax=Leersia perrieri TaxID=77586 RepID=A0A0D9XTF5_9ORYZ